MSYWAPPMARQGRAFKLLHAPVLARQPETDYLVVEQPGGQPEHWREVADFGDSAADDKNYRAG